MIYLTSLPIDLIKDYIPYAMELDMESIKSEMLPGQPEKCNGVWLYIQDKSATKELINSVFEEQNEKQKTQNHQKYHLPPIWVAFFVALTLFCKQSIKAI